MSRITSQTTSIEFKLVSGLDKDGQYEFISLIANQDVSVRLTKTESNTMKRVVNAKLEKADEKVLMDLYKKISKQIDITTHE